MAEAHKTSSETLIFLGLAGYCDRFIPKFVDLVCQAFAKEQMQDAKFLGGGKITVKTTKTFRAVLWILDFFGSLGFYSIFVAVFK